MTPRRRSVAAGLSPQRVKALSVDTEQDTSRDVGRPSGWMRYVMPAVAAMALIGVILAGTGPGSRSDPPARRIVIDDPDAPSPVAMTWETRQFLSTRFVGLTADRENPSGVAIFGAGMPGLVDLLSGEIDVSNFFSKGEYATTALLQHPEDPKVIAWQNDRVDLWHLTNPKDEDQPDLLPQSGLEDLTTLVEAASSDTVELILGMDEVGRVHGWIGSGDGHWVKRVARGIRRAELDVLVAVDGNFFTGGSRCDGSECVPAIWRSSDGIEWTEVGDFGSIAGTVTGIAASETGGLSAVGSVAPGIAVAWQSTDGGTTWVHDDARGLGSSIQISVASIDTTASPRTARLLVEGVNVEVGEGTVLVTSLGEVGVPALGDAAVFVAGGHTRAVAPGNSWELYAETRVEDVDASGGWLVAAGSRTLPGSQPQPVIWVREEGSEEWRVNVLVDSIALPREVSIGTRRVAVTGSTDLDSVVWLGTWNAPTVERAAVAALERLLEGVSGGDSMLLHQSVGRPAHPASRLDLPGLGGKAAQPWDDTGVVDEDALADVVDFTTRLGVSIGTSNCTTRPDFGDVETVEIVCAYATDSLLHELLELGRSEGTLRATTHRGLVTDITATEAEEGEAWNDLAAFITAYGADLVEMETSSQAPLEALRVDGRTAQTMLAAARQLDRSWFFPGDTRTTESPLGTLEVSWIVSSFGGLDPSFTDLVWTGSSLVATTSDWQLDEPASGLWTSPDGVTWTAMPDPRPTEAYRLYAGPEERIVAVQSTRDTEGLWILESGTWRELEEAAFEETQGGALTGIEDVAITAGGVLVLRETWGQATETHTRSMQYVGNDGTASPVNFPSREADNAAVVASRHGFLLITQDALTTQMWRTRSGEAWSLLEEMATETFGRLRDLVPFRDGFLALTFGDWEQYCGDASEECSPPSVLWTSEAGETWTRAASEPQVTQQSAGRLAAGELGLVLPAALPQSYLGRSLLIWMSADGDTWSVPPGFLPRTTGSGWLEAGRAVVGDSWFVIPVNHESPDGNDEPSTSLIVARRVDD